MKSYLSMILILLLVICSGCSKMANSFESSFDSRQIMIQYTAKLIAPIEDFQFGTLLLPCEATLKKKTHDVVATINVYCYDESNYSKFHENQDVLHAIVKDTFKFMSYDEFIEMDDYQKIELYVKYHLLNELSMESKKLHIEITDIVVTER